MADTEVDAGVPEEQAGQLDQGNAVDDNPRGAWLNSSGIWTFQNYADLTEYGSDIIARPSTESGMVATLVMVIDNKDVVDLYPDNKHYWVAVGANTDNSSAQFRTLTKHLYSIVEGRGSINQFTPPAGSIQLSTWRSVPVYVGNPAIDDSRPVSQTGVTSSATTGISVATTTIANPLAAGINTISETIKGIPALLAGNLLQGVFGSLGANVITGMGPCLPNNPPASTGIAGSGATPPASVPYDDAIIRQARAAAAAPASTTVVAPYDDAILRLSRTATTTPPAFTPFSDVTATATTEIYQDAILRQRRPTTALPYQDAIMRQAASSTATTANTGNNPGNPNAAGYLSTPTATPVYQDAIMRQAAATAANTTAPTTVTDSAAGYTTGASAPSVSANVYVYEPLTPGFDRYDFNTGKKVYTTEGGQSQNAAGQYVAPQSNPSVPSTTNDANAAADAPYDDAILRASRRNLSTDAQVAAFDKSISSPGTIRRPTRPGQSIDRTLPQPTAGQTAGPF